jgi:hypothetical protein
MRTECQGVLTWVAEQMTAAQMTTRIYSGAANMPPYTGNITPQQLYEPLAFLLSRHSSPLTNMTWSVVVK